MKSLGISHRLWIGFGILILFLSINAGAALTQMRDMTAVMDRLVDEVVAQMHRAQALSGNLETFENAQKSALLARATLRIQEARQRFAEADATAARIDEDVQALQGIAQVRGQKLLRSFEENWESYLAVHAEVKKQARMGQIDPALGLLEDEGKPLIRDARQQLDALVQILTGEFEDQRSRVASGMERGQWIQTGILAASIVLGVWLAYSIARYIRRGLAQVRRVTRQVAEGDLTARTELDQVNEIGEMGAALDGTCENFQGIVRRMVEAAEETAAQSEQLASASHRVLAGMERQEQATDRAGRLMETNVAHVGDVVQHSARASRAADRADELSRRGMQTVEGTLAAIRRLVEKMDEAGRVINHLDDHSGQIGSVVDVIREITEQTNLLSLNAAIEAARAGEQGRGFAVVADEVRTLSLRTQDSTDQISRMIDSLKGAMHEAIAIMQESHDYAGRTLREADEAGHQLSDIDSAVGEIREMNARIVGAAEQQRNQVNELKQALEEITAINGDTVTVTQETDQASRSMQQHSADLQAMVARFRV